MARKNYYSMFFRYVKLLILKNETVGGYVEQAVAKYGDKPFLLFEEDTYTFAEFNRRANQRANFFREQGIVKGDVVPLMMENRPEFVETLIGLGKIGAVTAGINTNLRGKALIHSLKVAEGKLAIIGKECMAAYKEAMAEEKVFADDKVFVDTRWKGGAAAPKGSHNLNKELESASEAAPPKVKLGSDDLFMYIYTSGTTGLPKAAKISHLRLVAAGLAFGWYVWGVRETDTIYCALPLYHSNGALLSLGPAIRNGAALALSRKFSASLFWEECTKYKATCAIYIGEVLRYLVNQPPGKFDRKHKVDRVLGNGLRPDIWAEFQKRFKVPHVREFYASTEGNTYLVNLDDVPGSVGQSLVEPSNMVLVRYDVESDTYPRDGNGFCVKCKPGEIGELLGKIKGTTPFAGYSGEQETNKKILRDVFKKGDAYFKTGDLLKQDTAGYYYFIDRIGDTFRWKGENVSTNEVSEILGTYPKLAMANVYGVEIEKSEGRAGMAALIFDKGAKFDPKKFYTFTEDKLPAYARPLFVRIQADMQVTGTFKMTKTELKKEAFDPAVVKDKLYFRDAKKGTYVAITKKLATDIHSGKLKL